MMSRDPQSRPPRESPNRARPRGRAADARGRARARAHTATQRSGARRWRRGGGALTRRRRGSGWRDPPTAVATLTRPHGVRGAATTCQLASARLRVKFSMAMPPFAARFVGSRTARSRRRIHDATFRRMRMCMFVFAALMWKWT